MNPWKLARALWGTLCCLTASLAGAQDSPTPIDDPAAPLRPYHEQVLEDAPVAYWDFSPTAASEASPGDGQPAAAPRRVESRGASPFPATVVGRVELEQPGPRSPRFPAFAEDNLAGRWFGERGYLAVTDPGEASPLDFTTGDSLTLEAWVQLERLPDGQHAYVVGKGRTSRPGVAADNQNYALRLTGAGGTARISFLFRSAGAAGQFHRWTSTSGFAPGERWRHVAVSYRFGDPTSVRGYVDGAPVTGEWDMGGPTEAAPVVDDDELWIGASMGGAGGAFRGRIDELAIHRQQLGDERLRSRFALRPAPPRDIAAELRALGESPVVRIAVHAGLGEHPWDEDRELPAPLAAWDSPRFAASGLPQTYVAEGVRDEPPNPLLVRLVGRRTLEAGDHEWVLRCKSASRLYLDGKLVAETPFMSRNASGHEPVPELAPPADGLPQLLPGHRELRFRTDGPARTCLVEWELVVGGKSLRPEIGETALGWRRAGEPGFQLLVPDGAKELSLDEPTWLRTLEEDRVLLAELDRAKRRSLAAQGDGYWNERHRLAREVAASRAEPTPAPVAGYPARNVIDQWVNARLAEAGLKPTAPLDDLAFLRRLSLDVVGEIPSAAEQQVFLADPVDTRRARAIDRLLADPRWADHWVAYWQDVLAENPGILKPELNNTGPFRFWIHESFLDHKPFDRMVSELVRMEGGKYAGGPAGFAMASQNDVPLAAKAHVLAQAFLGVEMRCARCHDAPYHPYKQEQLFAVAALLAEKPLDVPATSSVPQNPGGRQPLVEVTLQPGEQVTPRWAFEELIESGSVDDLLREGDGARERLAALITSPHNVRFPEVVVNRLWRRYLGRAIVEPVDDWHEATPSHPELLRYLALELMSHDYDLRHVARLILNSDAYQRSVELSPPDPPLFAGPLRRRLTAEQLLDSMVAAAGKSLRVEALTFDPEGRRDASTFLNLGAPSRSWEFTSLANERDRPALALPGAQPMIDLLVAFGWRDSRPNPLTQREEAPNILQPLTLANGLATLRATRLSDDHAVTELALRAKSVESLVDALFERFLTRAPTADERARLVEFLREGFADRALSAPPNPPARLQHAVSWSNHLHADATRIKQELERQVRAGDPPSARLASEWRERLEDVVWALLNSPEFVFVP